MRISWYPDNAVLNTTSPARRDVGAEQLPFEHGAVGEDEDAGRARRHDLSSEIGPIGPTSKDDTGRLWMIMHSIV